MPPCGGAPYCKASNKKPNFACASSFVKLNAENTELKDRMLRTLAEMENLRRRTEKEVADSKLYGVTNLAREMLGFADNLRRALDVFENDTVDETAFKALIREAVAVNGAGTSKPAQKAKKPKSM